MSYIQRLLEKREMSKSGTDRTDKTPAPKNEECPFQVPTELPKPGSVSSVGTQEKESSDSGPSGPHACTSPKAGHPWSPRRPPAIVAEIGRWPIPRRRRLGDLCNDLEDQGVPFPESERRAYHQVKAEMEATAS